MQKYDYSLYTIWYRQWRLTITWTTRVRRDTYFTRICDCWKKWKSPRYYFIRGQQSCWCAHTETRFKSTHWLTGDKVWRKLLTVYNSIYGRCNNPNQKAYKYYWWKWIKCERTTPESFYNDMVDSFKEHSKIHWEHNTSLDRIDNSKNYCKGNCRRVTLAEQQRNKTTNIKTIVDGQEYHSRDIAHLCWISTHIAWCRIRKYNQWKTTKEKLFHVWLIDNKNRKKDNQYIINIDWKEYTSSQLCEITWLSKSWAQRRMKRYLKWTLDKEWLFVHV